MFKVFFKHIYILYKYIFVCLFRMFAPTSHNPCRLSEIAMAEQEVLVFFVFSLFPLSMTST